jgi:hypothetical protein
VNSTRVSCCWKSVGNRVYSSGEAHKELKKEGRKRKDLVGTVSVDTRIFCGLGTMVWVECGKAWFNSTRYFFCTHLRSIVDTSMRCDPEHVQFACGQSQRLSLSITYCAASRPTYSGSNMIRGLWQGVIHVSIPAPQQPASHLLCIVRPAHSPQSLYSTS